ncbi:DUF317 domain-containing protein [Kitasatospora sp. NPDC097605]|uniref:DUF317 domain-containing protein n=1 Tax=Kitasatospora sp. NPDC097605 TaxID=3157226 RepID=UPI00332C04CE
MDSTTSSAPPARAPRARRPHGLAPKPRVAPSLPNAPWATRIVGVRPPYLALGSYSSVVRARRVLQEAQWAGSAQGFDQAFSHGGIQVLLHDPADQAYQREALIAHGPGWHATFSAQTPDEVLASAAEALVEAAAAGTDGASDRCDLDEALYCLSEAGWDGADTRDGAIVRITSPDHLAEILCPPDQQAWLVTAGMDGEGWEAELVGDCPDALVESVIGCLAAESPARRRTSDLPTALRRYLEIGPDPYRSDAARETSPAARAAAPAALVITPAQSPAAAARRSR